MANFRGLGVFTVPVPGTPVHIVIPAAQRIRSCHAFSIQALHNNTGKIFVGTTGMNATTFANVLAQLPIPTVNLIPSFTSALAQGANAIPLEDLWIDADVADEGVILSVLEG